MPNTLLKSLRPTPSAVLVGEGDIFGTIAVPRLMHLIFSRGISRGLIESCHRCHAKVPTGTASTKPQKIHDPQAIPNKRPTNYLFLR
jgi:hypothetical protein